MARYSLTILAVNGRNHQGDTMKKGDRFIKGSGCYTCQACHKLTRSTGRGDNEHVRLCAPCYDEGGLINEHLDGGHVIERNSECPECRKD